jgi:hypothetical protein
MKALSESGFMMRFIHGQISKNQGDNYGEQQ